MNYLEAWIYVWSHTPMWNQVQVSREHSQWGTSVHLNWCICYPSRRRKCVKAVRGLIETGPFLCRHWCVSNESISLTAQSPEGCCIHDHRRITDECVRIGNAICHYIWVCVCLPNRGEKHNSCAGAPVCRSGQLEQLPIACRSCPIVSTFSASQMCVFVFTGTVQGQ